MGLVNSRIFFSTFGEEIVRSKTQETEIPIKGSSNKQQCICNLPDLLSIIIITIIIIILAQKL